MDNIRFRLHGEELPWPSLSSLTFADAVVVNLVTGLDLATFHDQANESKIAGLIAVALQRAHPDWHAVRVAEAVRSADISGWELLGAEVAEPVPPSQPETGESSGTSGSTGSAGGSSELSA